MSRMPSLSSPFLLGFDEIERVLALGATMVNDLRKPDRGWAVLADPEGNEFCILMRTSDLPPELFAAGLPRRPSTPRPGPTRPCRGRASPTAANSPASRP